MRMRRRGTRGEPLKWGGQDVTYLETMQNSELAKVLIQATQTLAVVEKSDLNLPIIDTKDYEKIESSTISD